VEGRPEHQLGVCDNPKCGEWIAAVAGTSSDARWLIAGRTPRWAWPDARTAQPIEPAAV
jgi:hypothetical protein